MYRSMSRILAYVEDGGKKYNGKTFGYFLQGSSCYMLILYISLL
jgi:hypothetical protein